MELGNKKPIRKTDGKNPVVWYLHPYAGSPSIGMSYRPYYLCQEFNKNDCAAYIISASFQHLLVTLHEQKESVSHRQYNKQDYIFLKTPVYERNNWKRLMNMFSYAWKVWRHKNELINITGVPTVIIVSSAHPFHFYSAQRIAKKHNAQLIFEVRDLWPESLVQLHGIPMYNPLILLLKGIVKLAYKHSDLVVSLLPNALPHMVKYGLDPKRFVYISNGAATQELLHERQELPDSYVQLIAEKKEKGIFLIGYTGSHGTANALDDLLDALILLENEDYRKVHFLLVGNGYQKERLRIYAEKNRLTSVTFLNALPKNQILPFLEQMDATYIGWKNKPVYHFGISPNKLFDYMLAAKPILHAFVSKQDIVSETRCGLVVEAENSAEIAKGIRSLVAIPKNELYAMGERGRDALLSKYSYTELGKRYLRLFKLSKISS